jgi:short subunit dehydrogenase-like uncharacterized protein
MDFLLYGANGFTGKLIVEHAVEMGLRPVLAGRSEDKIRPLAEQYGLDYRIADLGYPNAVRDMLEGVKVVLHAAGPFKHTAKPMVDACLQTGTHYTDITGEIGVFEAIAARHKEGEERGVILLPGIGFDVVPTDCLACFLKEQLPDATHLQLAFTSLKGKISHGTAATSIEYLGEGGAIRADGRIKKVPIGHKAMTVPFKGTDRFVMAIPWGDVSTAYHSTGIPNIETYFGIRPKTYKMVKRQWMYNWLLKTPIAKRMARRRLAKAPAGPNAEQRKASVSLVWGKVWNAAGEECQARLVAPETYTLTALTGLYIIQKILSDPPAPGFQTPAKAFGADLILQIPNTRREVLQNGLWT